MPLDALIFDLDGTLVDTNRLHIEAWRRVLQQREVDLAFDRIAVEIGKGGDQLVRSLIGHEQDQRHGKWLRGHQPKEFSQIAEQRGIRVFPGARELVAAARQRGLRTALATSSDLSQLAVTFAHCGVDWSEQVDCIVHADDIEQSKPSPDVVKAALKKLGIAPGQAALIGDTPYDAQAARDAGVVCLGLESGGFDANTLRASGARRIWKSVEHLLSDFEAALHIAAPAQIRLTHSAVEQLMDEALAVAAQGMAAGEAPIGSVIARGDGTIIATGYNRQNGLADRTAHAEIIAFRDAAGRVAEDAIDLIMVATLEPCVMCLGAAMESGVDTVIYGLNAPADGGTRRVTPPLSPEANMPRVIGGIRSDASRRLFEQFLHKPSIKPQQAAFVRQLLQST